MTKKFNNLFHTTSQCSNCRNESSNYYFLAGKLEKCSTGTVSRVLNIVALTPPNTTVAKSDVWILFYFLWPHISLKPLKYKGQKTMTSVANCFQLKVAKTGHLMLLDDLIKVSSLIYIYIYIDQWTHLYDIMGESRNVDKLCPRDWFCC